MKGVVLAAGLGTRMRPLTERWPKCLLPLAGRPLMAHILDHLYRHGFREIFINTFWRANAIEQAIGDGRAFGLRIHYLREDALSGTAGPLRKLAGHLGRERFLVLNGDNLTDLDLTALIEFHHRRYAELTVALHREEPVDLQQKSVAETTMDGRMTRFVEKPRATQLYSDWSSAGVYVFEHSVLGWIPEGEPYDIGHDLIPSLLS